MNTAAVGARKTSYNRRKWQLRFVTRTHEIQARQDSLEKKDQWVMNSKNNGSSLDDYCALCFLRNEYASAKNVNMISIVIYKNTDGMVNNL